MRSTNRLDYANELHPAPPPAARGATPFNRSPGAAPALSGLVAAVGRDASAGYQLNAAQSKLDRDESLPLGRESSPSQVTARLGRHLGLGGFDASNPNSSGNADPSSLDFTIPGNPLDTVI